MKVKIRSALKTISHDFQCFQDQNILYLSGNTLCIRQIGKREAEFICLNRGIKQIYSFKPSPNRKGVFTAERLSDSIEVAYYTLKGDRKSVNLTQQSSFFAEIQRIELLVDEYENSLVFGAARNKEETCIFLCDITKGKILAQGFLSHFEDLKAHNQENVNLSVCGFNGSYNYVKMLKFDSGQWQIEEFLYKKMGLHHGAVICHQLLAVGRLLMATKKSIYIFEGIQILQILELGQNQSIRSILKIPKAFLALMQDQSVKVYIEDSDEVTFNERGNISIALDQGDMIYKMLLSHNNEEVIIKTVKSNLYAWKIDRIELESGHSQMKFYKVETSFQSGHEGSISLSASKHYCLLSGSKDATLLDLEKNEIVHRSQFSNLESNRKGIITSAINPDGNSFILAFDDVIRIYTILLTKFKFSAEFLIKRCQSIVYSHGGQLVACKYGRGLNSCIEVINLMRMAAVNTIKVQAQPIQIIWNELDDEIIVAGQNKTVQVFKVSQSTRIYSVTFDSTITHVRMDFHLQKLLVSTENKISVINEGKLIEEITPSIEGFHYVFPLYGLYFIVSKTGVLYWSSSLRCQNYRQFSLFTQKPFNLICKDGFLIAFTSLREVMLLECMHQHSQKRKNDHDLVMVEREEIIEVFDKVKSLENHIDILMVATQVKLEQEKNNYEIALKKFKQEVNKEIKFLNSKFNDQTSSKQAQAKESEKLFQNLQVNQIKSIFDLQSMFNRKFNLEKDKMMNLQQELQEQKLRFEKTIFNLQAKYHREVSYIREQYAKKVREEAMRAQEVKINSLQNKEHMEIKFMDLAEENQHVVTSIQQDSTIVINELKQKIKELENQYNLILIKYQNQSEQMKKIEDEEYGKNLSLRKLEARLQEDVNRIEMLQREVANKKETIIEKNHVINEQTYQISLLQKAKTVLSFRSNEILKQFQPKQSLIEKLKSQMFKLDEQFKKEKKKVFQLNQKIQKLQKCNETTKKENIQTKSQLTQKERLHDQLCWEFYMVINTVDQKEWTQAFLKLYQTYIKEEKFKNRGRKKDETSQQINRHLMHVEQSLYHTSIGNSKSLKRKDEEITKKMEENSLLLCQLNALRKNERVFEKQKKEMSVIIDRLKREAGQSYKSSNEINDRTFTARSGITKRFSASREVVSRQKSTIIDIHDFDTSKEVRDLKTRSKIRSKMSSAYKTLMLRNEMRQQTSKYNQISKEFQTYRNTFNIQDNQGQ